MANIVEIKGVESPVIVSMIKNQILSETKYDTNSKGSISNESRLTKDKDTIITILHSFGYFDAEIDASEKMGIVIFYINLNERYKFNEVLLRYEDDKEYRTGLKVGQVFDLINIEFNSYTSTKQISTASDNIKKFLQQRGFAFVYIMQPELEIDKEKKKIKVVYNISLNRKIIMDKVIVKITSKKDPKLLESFVRNRVPWEDGDIYDPSKIEDLKEALMTSGIFAGIEVHLSDPSPEPKNPKLAKTTVTIDVKEAKLRSVAVGLKYGTVEKLGATLAWTHYNIDGKGSRLSLILDGSDFHNRHRKMFSTKIKYSVYDLFFKKQELVNQIYYVKENTISYDLSKIGAESILWQEFNKSLKLGAGACIEDSTTLDKVEKGKNKTRFKAIGIPIGINFDTTTAFLDPQKGLRCNGMLTPYFGNKRPITILTGKASIYLPIAKNSFKNAIVLACYGRAGSILCDKSQQLPRDKRFFGGGANSIRGYGYQMLGKLNDRRKPLGGQSIFEIGIEPRIKITDNFGCAIFAEGGNVYSGKLIKPFKDMLWGYGFGVRYYTMLGPIRLDIAFPMKRRHVDKDKKSVDSRFNIYVSIGQAF